MKYLKVVINFTVSLVPLLLLVTILYAMHLKDNLDDDNPWFWEKI